MPKIALIQLSVDARPSVNKEKTESAIREAAANGAQIVCTQELFTTEYFCRTEECDLFDLAEPVPGELTEAHRKLAAELGVVIVASGFEKRATGLYHNTAWVVDADGSFLGMYRKMHIPQDPGFEEKFYFTPGDLGYKAFDTKFGRIGVLICWDQWYPEAARLTAMQGAEIIFYQDLVRRVPVPEHIYEYAVKLVRATRPTLETSPEWVKQYVAWGAGPRAVQFLILGAKTRAALQGSYIVRREDIDAIVEPVLMHRVVTNFAAESQGITPRKAVARLAAEI